MDTPERMPEKMSEKEKPQIPNTYREGISLEEALEIILSHTARTRRTETVPILNAGGRILAEDRITQIENPPFDRSPVDGYACRSGDIRDASKEHPAVLRVTAELDAGQYLEDTVRPGEAVRIMTGAPIPSGCDCCIRQEDTDYGKTTVRVYQPEAAHGNFCDRGEDFAKGICMLRAGERLDSIAIANLAAMGEADVPVLTTPRIAFFTTGDELSEPGQELAPGKIYNSNYYLLAARLAELGVPAEWSGHLPDDAEVVADAIRESVEQGADLVLTTGGVSVGKKDILHDAIALLDADKLFWRVRFKPGMPTVFSLYRQVPLVSLSGNPFGALASLELLVRPMLAKMSGDSTLTARCVCGILKDDFPKKSPGRRFIRAYYEDGAVYLPDSSGKSCRGQSSTVQHSNGVLASMRGCNCLIDIPAGSPPLKEGELVSVRLLARSEDLCQQDNGCASDSESGDVSGRPRIFAISGVKNSGKTTLITGLIPAFSDMGWKVAVIKHDSHGFDPDVPGTDSYRFRESGACGTAVFSKDLSMLIRQETAAERSLVCAFPDADLILLEGFKGSDYPKIEIVREGNSETSVCDADSLAGIATDRCGTDGFPADIPVLNLNSPEEIARFIRDCF